MVTCVLADLILTTRADCALTSVCRVAAVVNRRSAQPAEMINFVSAVTLSLPDVKDRLLAQGHTAVGSKPDEFARHIAQEVVKWRKVVRDSGAKAE